MYNEAIISEIYFCWTRVTQSLLFLRHLQMKRQQRKLNFLITQTELYAHFMAGKMTGATEADKNRILKRLEEGEPSSGREQEGALPTTIPGDDYGTCYLTPLKWSRFCVASKSKR